MALLDILSNIIGISNLLHEVLTLEMKEVSIHETPRSLVRGVVIYKA